MKTMRDIAIAGAAIVLSVSVAVIALSFAKGVDALTAVLSLAHLFGGLK